MIDRCPFCGYLLELGIKDGITGCNNCNRIFGSTSKNKILSAAWVVRREGLEEIEIIKKRCNLTNEESDIVENYIINEGYNHDDFLKFLKSYK
jgi:hypothetical protein